MSWLLSLIVLTSHQPFRVSAGFLSTWPNSSCNRLLMQGPVRHVRPIQPLFASPMMIDRVEKDRPIRRPLILVDDETGEVLAQGQELEPFPEERNKLDEDELEILYPTQRQFFQFGKTTGMPVLQVRSTSFGCSKMGHQIWPSSLALCLSLIHDYGGSDWPKSVLELGAGCGLPSIVCRDILQVPQVIATDFWYPEQQSQRVKDRLVPEVWHGINLQYNVERQHQGAVVKPLDWHDLESVRQAATPSVDLVIASDVVYYHMDIVPLWNTIETLLRECGALKVVLVLPVKPETRESLPAFVEVLESKASTGTYVLERQQLHLYKSQESFDTRQDSDRFLKFSLSIKAMDG